MVFLQLQAGSQWPKPDSVAVGVHMIPRHHDAVLLLQLALVPFWFVLLFIFLQRKYAAHRHTCSSFSLLRAEWLRQ